jgi:hypothetical protein
MAIDFPNSSRSYDLTRNAVQFWGHDLIMESSFFVTADALKQIQPDVQSGPDALLRVFDDNRDRIYTTAARVYARAARTPATFTPPIFSRRSHRLPCVIHSPLRST